MDCNKDVQWYQSVKETQGSVETTSYGQMNNILKYGTYRVGFKKNAQTVHDLISVTLSQLCQNIVKWKYSLDELRDLESKLVLICGNKAENRVEVEHYLNVSKGIYVIGIIILCNLLGWFYKRLKTNPKFGGSTITCLTSMFFTAAPAQCHQNS